MTSFIHGLFLLVDGNGLQTRLCIHHYGFIVRTVYVGKLLELPSFHLYQWQFWGRCYWEERQLRKTCQLWPVNYAKWQTKPCQLNVQKANKAVNIKNQFNKGTTKIISFNVSEIYKYIYHRCSNLDAWIVRWPKLSLYLKVQWTFLLPFTQCISCADARYRRLLVPLKAVNDRKKIRLLLS